MAAFFQICEKITEVGLTIFSKYSLFNTTEKLINYISPNYIVDLENSDI